MAIYLSQLYGKEIITYSGKKLGRVGDVIIDSEAGKIVKLSLQQIVNTTAAPEILKKFSINYEDVLEVGDVVVVQRGPATLTESPSFK
ncbi:MAG: PRC-barrel domain-containing protein [Candidatus Altarchaeum sp.]|nr:PRC-barrel domain-containing protein [Candidatus Altarchaeum sp.]